MTRSPQHPSGPDERRIQVVLAVITGLLAGATRALAGWLFEHLTSGN